MVTLPLEKSKSVLSKDLLTEEGEFSSSSGIYRGPLLGRGPHARGASPERQAPRSPSLPFTPSEFFEAIRYDDELTFQESHAGSELQALHPLNFHSPPEGRPAGRRSIEPSSDGRRVVR